MLILPGYVRWILQYIVRYNSSRPKEVSLKNGQRECGASLANNLLIRIGRVRGRRASEHLLSKPELYLRGEAHDRGAGGIARTAKLDGLDLLNAPQPRRHDRDAILH